MGDGGVMIFEIRTTRGDVTPTGGTGPGGVKAPEVTKKTKWVRMACADGDCRRKEDTYQVEIQTLAELLAFCHGQNTHYWSGNPVQQIVISPKHGGRRGSYVIEIYDDYRE
jgi:hypothetical protein